MLAAGLDPDLLAPRPWARESIATPTGTAHGYDRTLMPSTPLPRTFAFMSGRLSMHEVDAEASEPGEGVGTWCVRRHHEFG